MKHPLIPLRLRVVLKNISDFLTKWLSSCPKLNPIDFYVRSDLKRKVCITTTTIATTTTTITTTAITITTTTSTTTTSTTITTITSTTTTTTTTTTFTAPTTLCVSVQGSKEKVLHCFRSEQVHGHLPLHQRSSQLRQPAKVGVEVDIWSSPAEVGSRHLVYLLAKVGVEVDIWSPPAEVGSRHLVYLLAKVGVEVDIWFPPIEVQRSQDSWKRLAGIVKEEKISPCSDKPPKLDGNVEG
ncbi:hypothetical protein FHG87_012754 [Trinorchestia longiramus]|nr:hypothetical protein FHG87_012754 [Trinorchestia longiramus]